MSILTALPFHHPVRDGKGDKGGGRKRRQPNGGERIDGEERQEPAVTL